MKTNMLGITVVSLLATTLAVAPIQGFAQEKPKEKPAASENKDVPKGEKKEGNIPFHGKLGAVDKTAKTITVGKRTFQITSDSKLSKGGKPATLDDAVVGEEVSGNYQTSDAGKWSVKTVRFGPKPGGETKKATSAKREKK